MTRRKSYVWLLFMALMVSMLFFNLGCASRALRELEVSFGSPLTVRGEELSQLAGLPKPDGEVVITFEAVQTASSVKDVFTGKGDLVAQGRFVAIQYTVENKLTTKLQPASQINDQCVIVDSEGRKWETIDYRAPLMTGVSGDFAISLGARQPEEWIDPGFVSKTAMAFDIPVGSHNLCLRSESLGINLPLTYQGD